MKLYIYKKLNILIMGTFVEFDMQIIFLLKSYCLISEHELCVPNGKGFHAVSKN